ncbi:hypothetical protein N7490_007328 [Penicillium lividum]|nr:hypothetical protein N7490_007328 [Penicillium lividum]
MYRHMGSVFNTTLASDTWADGTTELTEDQDTKSLICILSQLTRWWILRSIYGSLTANVPLKIQEADLKELMDMEGQLNSWYESLPTDLQDNTQPNNLSDLVKRRCITLLMRCLSFKSRLYRDS